MSAESISGLMLTAVLITAPPQPAAAAAHVHPIAQRTDQIDSYHGTQIADPYRWMEDIDSNTTRAWVEAEAKLTNDYLEAIPGRDRIARRLKAIWNCERWSTPEKHGPRWVFGHNDGLQNQSVLLTTADPALPARLLLDPNAMSRDGTIAFKGAGYSDDGRLMAYGLSEAGSDWEVWHVRDVASGKDLSDEVRRAKFTGATWRKDGSGFFYSGYDASEAAQSLKAQNKYHAVFFHALGTPDSQDKEIYARRDDTNWIVGAQVTDDGRYLVVNASHGTDVKNTLLVADLTTSDSAVKPVIAEPVANYTFIGNIGTTIYVQTDDAAPRYRVIAIDLSHPNRRHWRSVLAESDDTLDSVTLVGHQLIAHYLRDAHSIVRRYTPDGSALGDVHLPGIGAVSGFAGRIDDMLTYYVYTDFTTPSSIYLLDLGSGESSLWRASALAGFNAAEYETKQVFYLSKDRTRVPMFVTARKGQVLDGNNPTILYGYGGFDDSLQPSFTPGVTAWLERGGVYAVANLRGGGE